MSVFDQWEFISRDVGIVIRHALLTGSHKRVTVDIHQDRQSIVRTVDYVVERGWVTLEGAELTDIIYDGGELFSAAFAAVVGRPPAHHECATPARVVDALTVRREV